MKNNIVVVFSSHLSEEENQKFIKHIDETIGVKHTSVCYPNYNQFGLAQIYNDALKTHKVDNCIFVMCHNDIIIKTKNWGKILLNHFNHSDYYGIIGIAGSTFIPDTGMWWGDFSKMYGIVEHTNGISSWVSEYSNSFNGVKPTINIDGLFMCIDPDKIIKQFNENYGLFHFYDLTFCVDNYLQDVNIGVITSIRVLHKSMGMTNQSWEDNRKKFATEYKLPMRLVPEKLRVLICCQFFKNYTGSEVSNYELSRELVKLGCDVTIISAVVGDPLHKKALANGVRVYSLSGVPNYVLDQNGKFQFFKNEREFDIIHINHKPIGETILGMYPNTPAVMHVRSEVIPVFEVPIVNPVIKRYISIRNSITDYIKTFGITGDKIVLIDNPFDTKRFNTNYKEVKNSKEIVLFIGTLDYLRKNILFDLVEMTKTNNQLLWIIGADSGGYAKDLTDLNQGNGHVKYLGIKANVEDYIKMCDYTAGIFKGRTTIEGFLCGKPGWIYVVDENGSIQSKTLQQVPEDVQKYSSKFSAEKVFKLYEEVIDETWL